MKILDTDVLALIVREDPDPRIARQLFQLTLTERVATTAINVAEVYYGLAKMRNGSELRRRYEMVVFPPLDILPFSAECAETLGNLRAELDSLGTPIGLADAMIAAIALTYGRPVVTCNVRHFERVAGLVVENWLDDPQEP
jgi:tRNA(fMet)-specific endonuclease VapC